MKKCVVIYNPNSGKSLKLKYIEEYKEILRKYDYDAKFITTEYRGHAREIAQSIEPTDLLISMGGDGTFNEVVSGNLKRKDPLVLAHIPVGTTNDVGVMFGYGKNVKDNLKKMLNGRIKGIDICTINNNPFVYVAGFGKFMHVPYDTPRKLKKKIGYFAYLVEGIKDFFNPIKLYNVSYKVDGIEKTGLYSFMLISSANRIAGINNFYRDVKLDDDKFEVLFCNFRRRIDMIKTFSLLMTHDASKVSGVEFYKTNKIELKFHDNPKNSWCIDGEKLETEELKYEIHNIRNVQIMMPTKNIDKIFINEKIG